MEPVGLVLDERGERGPGELSVVDTVKVVQHEHRVVTPSQVEIVGEHAHGVHQSDWTASRGSRCRRPVGDTGRELLHGRTQRDAELDGVAVRLVEGQPGRGATTVADPVRGQCGLAGSGGSDHRCHGV